MSMFEIEGSSLATLLNDAASGPAKGGENDKPTPNDQHSSSISSEARTALSTLSQARRELRTLVRETPLSDSFEQSQALLSRAYAMLAQQPSSIRIALHKRLARLLRARMLMAHREEQGREIVLAMRTEFKKRKLKPNPVSKTTRRSKGKKATAGR